MKKYILSSTTEREIAEPVICDTYEQAYAEMKRQFYEAAGVKGTYLERLTNAAEDKGWDVKVGEGYISFRRGTPAGEDFSFTVSVENVVEEVRDYYHNFCPETHAGENYNARKQGLSGVPDLQTLLDDAKEIEEMLEYLWDALADVDEDEESNGEIGSDYAYCTTSNHDDADWAIHEVDIPEVPAESCSPDNSKTGHFQFGDYVLTPIPNAFNKQTGWWLSRRNCSVAMYCFSTSGSDLKQAMEGN